MTKDQRRRRRKSERPSEILRAAIELFGEKGFAATQVSEIAKRAGVAKGTIYLYFPTKRELFEGIVRANVSPVIGRLEDMLMHAKVPAAELLEMVLHMMYQEFVESTTRQAILRVLIAEGPRFPELVEFYHREVLQFAERLLEQVVARGLATGEFRDCAAVWEPRVVIGPAILAVVWRLLFDSVAPLDAKSFLQAHIDLVLRGLLVRDDQ